MRGETQESGVRTKIEKERANQRTEDSLGQSRKKPRWGRTLLQECRVFHNHSIRRPANVVYRVYLTTQFINKLFINKKATQLIPVLGQQISK